MSKIKVTKRKSKNRFRTRFRQKCLDYILYYNTKQYKWHSVDFELAQYLHRVSKK